MSSSEEPLFDDHLPFEQLWQAIQSGNSDAQSLAVERIMPQMLECVQRRFGSCTTFEPEDAVASALRTIQRRQWEMTKGRGDKKEVIEPRNWGDLVGLLVTFAVNKARTHRKKRVMGQLPNSGTDNERTDWQPADDGQPVSELFMRQELREGLHEAVATLSESLDDMKRIILRGHLDGLTTKEICDELRESGIHRVEASVRTSWRTKILPELREMLQAYADGDD